MNTSLKERAYEYLGAQSAPRTADTDAAVDECLEEVEKLAHFRYKYKYYDAPPAFLLKEPYLGYLKGSVGVIVAAMTLGAEVDAKIRLLSRTHAAKAVVFDACASAYLEYVCDEYEKTLGDDLSFRFCPGYGGSDVGDLREIFALINPEKIGVTLTETGYMLPSKSMAGVIAVGGGARKSCKNCVVSGSCEYAKRGERCYGSEK